MPGDVVFRRARRQDVPSIVALLADDILGQGREDPGPPLPEAYLAAFDAIDRDPNQFLAVVDRGGEIVGVLQLTFIPGLSRRGSTRGLIESVRVARGAQGLGLGTRMFEWAIEQCRARGCSVVQLTSDKQREDAHRFYQRLGFEASHIGFKMLL